jgi:hypothetical protein
MLHVNCKPCKQNPCCLYVLVPKFWYMLVLAVIKRALSSGFAKRKWRNKGTLLTTHIKLVWSYHLVLASFHGEPPFLVLTLSAKWGSLSTLKSFTDSCVILHLQDLFLLHQALSPEFLSSQNLLRTGVSCIQSCDYFHQLYSDASSVCYNTTQKFFLSFFLIIIKFRSPALQELDKRKDNR